MKAIPIFTMLSVALALSSCSTSKAGKEEPVTQPQSATLAAEAAPVAAPAPGFLGKPQAPVEIRADLATDAATVRVKFHQAGAHVSVRVNGVDGLGLRGAETLATNLAVAAGEEKSFEVALSPGPGQGMLAVHVSGLPSGSQFPIGTTVEIFKATDAAGYLLPEC